MTLLGGQVIFGTPVFGVTNPTISIGLSSLSPIDLTPDHFGSTSQIVSVTTDNYTGYTATLNNPNNSTDLINTTDNTLIIPTITLPANAQSITVSAFTSGYGISTDGTNYVPAPTSVSSILINSSNTAGTSSHTITFGAKPATNTPSGTYAKTFVVTAVVNNPQYSITYNANAGTDTVTGMPPNQSAVISNTGTATLSDSVPIRSGFDFLGWDTDSTATTPTYATGNTNTITLEPTQANVISLYAIWEQAGGPSTVIVVNPDGSTTSTTTDQYGNVSEQNVDVNNRVTSYTIDTTNSTSGGLAVLPGENIDTGVIAFDGHAFTIHIVFKTNLANENGNFVLTALQPNGNNYDGFSLYNYNSGYLRIATYFNRPRSSTTGLLTPNSYSTLSSSALTGERTFDVTINYNPTGYNGQPIITGSLVGGYSGRYIRGNNTVPSNLSNATFTIGGNGIDGQDDMNNLTILELTITKDY